jgi:hypothetical protein
LLDSLKNPRTHVRYWAAHGLGSIGRPAMAALNPLKQLASSDPDNTVRFYAAAACRKLEN